MPKNRKPDLWRGLGVPIRHRQDVIDSKAALDLLERACAAATERGAECMRMISEITGRNMTDAERQAAYRGRKAAARAGIILPPWWALRIALRTMEAARKP